MEAEVDFGDVPVVLAGEQVKLCLFALRLSYSGKAVHRVFASGGQEAFFEGHVHAFRVLGGVPIGKVRQPQGRGRSGAGFTRARVETARWTAFRSHYGIEAFYCQPGLDGAHEKGGVEGDIGWFRRNHLVPVPEVGSLAELNALIDQWDIDDEARRLLVRKPGALPGATALEQARAAGKFTPVHDAWWAAACKAHGDREGTRALIEVLLLGRHLSHEHLVAGLAVALRAGALTADAVALEARKAAEAEHGEPADTDQPNAATVVTFLTERRLAHLPPDTRPLPSVSVYYQLLRRSRPAADRSAVGESS